MNELRRDELAPIRRAPGTDRPVVLAVGEVEANLVALEAMLRNDDIEIVTARSGRSALDVLLEREVAVAIIDVLMPDMDGFELAELIRGVERTRRIPIIFVSAGSTEEYRVFTGYETGAIDFLHKPLDARILSAKVDVLVSLDRQRRRAERACAETEALLRLARATAQSERPEDVYEPALDAMRDLFEAERSSILLLDEQGSMRFRAFRGLSAGYRAAVDRHSPWSPEEKDARPILVPDVTTDESLAVYRPVLAEEGIRSLAFVPLISGRKLLGKLMLYWPRPRAFSEHDQMLAAAIASEVATAISVTRLREAERRARERTRAVQIVADAALAHLEVEPLLREMLARVRRIFACDTATLLLVDAERTRLEVRACDGIEPEAWGGVGIPYGQGIAGKIAAEATPLIVPDMAAADVVSPVLRERLRSMMGVPLVLDRGVIGVLHIGCFEPREFTDDDVTLLQMVADRAAVAVDRASAHDALRAAQERLRIALSAGRMGVWEWSIPTGRVSWSETLERLHGLEPGTFPGTFEAWQRDVHPEDLDRLLRTVQETLQTGREHHVEYRIVRPDGELRWVAGYGNIVARGPDGRPAAMMGVCMDITERREALAELEQTLRYNEVFAGILAHDLRNPLGAIIGSAELLKERLASEGEAVDKSLGRIVSSGQRMARLIEQLLDFTRVRVGGGFELQAGPVDLGSICVQAVREIKLARPGWQVRVERRGDAGGHWDGDRLLQVVSNLVTNAGQHGVAGAEILVGVDGTGEDVVTLAVRNEGTIPEEMLGEMWKPFRVRPGSSSSGLGLGIYILREIVLAHGGTVDVASSGGSTCFTVHLPRRGPTGRPAR